MQCVQGKFAALAGISAEAKRAVEAGEQQVVSAVSALLALYRCAACVLGCASVSQHCTALHCTALHCTPVVRVKGQLAHASSDTVRQPSTASSRCVCSLLFAVSSLLALHMCVALLLWLCLYIGATAHASDGASSMASIQVAPGPDHVQGVAFRKTCQPSCKQRSWHCKVQEAACSQACVSGTTSGLLCASWLAPMRTSASSWVPCARLQTPLQL